jgi:hypothetical protein
MSRFILAVALLVLSACGTKPNISIVLARSNEAPVIPVWPEFAQQGNFTAHLDTGVSTRDGKPILSIGYTGHLCGYPWRYTIGIVQPGRAVKTFQPGPVGRGACGVGLSVSDLQEGPLGLFFRNDETGDYDSDYGRNSNFVLRLP